MPRYYSDYRWCYHGIRDQTLIERLTMTPRILDILRLVPLGLVVSALMMAYFHAGKGALNPLSGHHLWPRVSRRQFFGGLVLLGIIELLHRILRII